MALQDTRLRPLKDLRISVTDRCNMRCSYCMPREVFGPDYPFLPRADLLTFEEITTVVRLLVKRGVEKVRLTGGEPLLRKDIEVLIEKLAGIPGVKDLCLTTNGALLSKMSPVIKSAGLHRVTVSLDSLDPEIFQSMTDTGIPVDQVLEGIEAAGQHGLKVKINAVIKRGVNDDGVVGLARRFRGTGHVVRFIEFMDVGNSNGWSMAQVVPGKEILAALGEAHPLVPIPPERPGDVAKRFRYEDGQGEIGVITSVTQPFCGSCSRLRLSPDGKLYTCLFASQGHDLLGVLRRYGTEQVGEYIDTVWSGRADNYSEVRTSHTRGTEENRVEMSYIGG